MLSRCMIMIAMGWDCLFRQKRTLSKSISRLFCCLLNPGRNTISQSIVFAGKQDFDWSHIYKFYSRCLWNPSQLFDVVIKETIPYFDSDYISIAADETKIKKTGRKIPKTQYYPDPLSPPFHVNFIYAHRVLQFSATLPLYRQYQTADLNDTDVYNASRGIPIVFQNVASLKKPGKKATEQDREIYKQEKKRYNLSIAYNDMVVNIRKRYDENGAYQKRILIVGDGSFCNKTVFSANPDRVDTVARCRKDASLCFQAVGESRCFYDRKKFSPQSVAQDESIVWNHGNAIIGKKYRPLRYKEISDVYWQRGAGRKPLRLIVIAPRPYRTTKKGRIYYKAEAYLLTDNVSLSAKTLIQEYINRWEIEVNHRDEKSILGVGEAQVWNENSVEKHPAHLVASYSIMLLASLQCFGTERDEHYLQLPKWRKQSTRPSCSDLINLLKKEVEDSENLQTLLDLHFYLA